MHQDNFSKKAVYGCRQEVRVTKDQKLLIDENNKHEIGTSEILMKQQSAPEVDIGCFDGNPLNCKNFMAIFKEVVKNRIDDPCGQFFRLIK